MAKQIIENEVDLSCGDYFYGSRLRTGDQRMRDAFANGGGWIVLTIGRAYVRFAGNGTVAESDVWQVVQVES